MREFQVFSLLAEGRTPMEIGEDMNLNHKTIHSHRANIMKKLNINDFNIHNLAYYQTAFVHTSYTKLKDYSEYENIDKCLDLKKKSYEQMEFLGDSLLGCIVSSYLYRRYVIIHNQDEGFLTKLKIRFVCGEQLAYLSKCNYTDVFAQMKLYFLKIQLNLEQIERFQETKKKEVRINCNKLGRRTYFGREENFKKSFLLHLVESRTSCGELNLGLKLTSPQFA